MRPTTRFFAAGEMRGPLCFGLGQVRKIGDDESPIGLRLVQNRR
jgi:hypothetical protein